MYSNCIQFVVYAYHAIHELQALETVSVKYTGVGLKPGAVISDHSDGFRNAFVKVWPDARFGQCWPHIARKFGEGEYCSKKWQCFEEVQEHLRWIHLVHLLVH